MKVLDPKNAKNMNCFLNKNSGHFILINLNISFLPHMFLQRDSLSVFGCFHPFVPFIRGLNGI